MTGRLNRFLYSILRRVTLWQVTILLTLVVIAWSIVVWAHYLQTEEEHIKTVHVWTPDYAVSMHSLFSGGLQLDSAYSGAVYWKDTHPFSEYQKLDATANFVALVGGDQIRYLAVLRNTDGTVSVARATVALEIPGKDILETQTFSFDPAIGMVTVRYARSLLKILAVGVMSPFVIWFFINILMGIVCGFRWNAPIFTLKRVSA